MVTMESVISWLPMLRSPLFLPWGMGRGNSKSSLSGSGVCMRSMYRFCFLGFLAFTVYSMAQSDSMKNQSVQRGQKKFQQSCSMCHGAEAMGGMGPNLVQSSLTRHDENGNLITPVIQEGRV